MAKPGYEQAGLGIQLPAELGSLVDTLSSIRGASEAEIWDLRLRYGTLDPTQSLMAAQNRAYQVTEQYCNTVEAFVGIGQADTGIPPRYLNPIQPGSYPAFVRAGQELQPWLQLLDRHDPDASNSIVSGVVNVIGSGFNVSAFEAARSFLSQQDSSPDNDQNYSAQMILNNDGADLLDATLSDITYHTTDSHIARAFKGSRFFQEFADKNARLQINEHIIRLENHRPLDSDSEEFDELVYATISSLHNAPSVSNETARALNLIAELTPLDVQRIMSKCSTDTKSLHLSVAEHLLKLDNNLFTTEHEEVIKQSENALSDDAKRYRRLLEAQLEQDETRVTTDKVMYLASLVHDKLDQDDEHTLRAEAVFVAHNIPDETLSQTIANNRYLLADEAAQAIVIRRLARLGYASQALSYAGYETNAHDTWSATSGILQNMLAIYEESGDLQLLEHIEQSAERMKGENPLAFDVLDVHTLAVRKFAGAIKHGHQTVVDKAMAEMEKGHTSETTWERESCLALTTQMLIDSDNPALAERYARLLYADPQVSQQDAKTGHEAVVSVVQAYRKNNQSEEGLRLLQATVLNSGSLDFYALLGIQILAGQQQKPRQIPKTRRLNPTIRS